MVINIVEPGYPWIGWIIVGSFVGILVVLAILAEKFRWRVEAESFIIPAILFGFMGALGVAGASPLWQEDMREYAISDAITLLGFSSVDLDYPGFTANWHGEFFEGRLMEVGDGEFQILRLEDGSWVDTTDLIE